MIVAVGAGLAWDRRHAPMTKVIVAALVLGNAVYAWWLLPPAGTGVVGWLGPLALTLGVLGAAGALMTLVEPVVGAGGAVHLRNRPGGTADRGIHRH